MARSCGWVMAITFATLGSGVHPVIPPEAEPPPKSSVPLRRFRYDVWT